MLSQRMEHWAEAYMATGRQEGRQRIETGHFEAGHGVDHQHAVIFVFGQQADGIAGGRGVRMDAIGPGFSPVAGRVGPCSMQGHGVQPPAELAFGCLRVDALKHQVETFAGRADWIGSATPQMTQIRSGHIKLGEGRLKRCAIMDAAKLVK